MKEHPDWTAVCSQVRIFGTVSEACLDLMGLSWFIMHGALVPLPLLPLVLVQGMNTYVNWQNGLLQPEVRDDMG